VTDGIERRKVGRIGADMFKDILTPAVLMAIATVGVHAETTGIPTPDFVPGQIWSIKAESPTTAKVVVVRLEPNGNRTVVHVSVIDIPVPQGVSELDGIMTVGDMPFDKSALAASVDQLLRTDGQPAPGFQSAYDHWRADKDAGVFTTSVASAIQTMLAQVYCKGALGNATCNGQQGNAGAAQDSDWSAIARWVGSGGRFSNLDEPTPTLYYDTERIEADHDIVRGYSLLDYNISAHSHSGERMLSQIDYWAIDCTKQMMTNIETTQYSGRMGHGRVVYDHTFTGSELKTALYSKNSGAGDLAQKICSQPGR